MYGYLYSQCHNKTITEDLTQKTFLRAYQSLERYDGTCKLSVWLCQIAKHLWYQYLEKHKREVLQDIQEELPYDRGIYLVWTIFSVMYEVQFHILIKNIILITILILLAEGILTYFIIRKIQKRRNKGRKEVV